VIWRTPHHPLGQTQSNAVPDGIEAVNQPIPDAAGFARQQTVSLLGRTARENGAFFITDALRAISPGSDLPRQSEVLEQKWARRTGPKEGVNFHPDGILWKGDQALLNSG
jgi:hypothetical protein